MKFKLISYFVISVLYKISIPNYKLKQNKKLRAFVGC